MSFVVFYHANCADGAAAAWAVFHGLGAHVGAVYIACNYGDNEWQRHVIDGANVIFVDFSEPRDQIVAICERAKSVLVLDHHKTAKATLTALMESPDKPHNLSIVFDMDRSGAQIAWDHFNVGQPRPRLIDYVADRDLWQFKLEDSKAISAYIWLYKTNIPEFAAVHANLEEDLEACAEQGKTVMSALSKQALDDAEKLAILLDKDGNTYGFGNVVNNISETADAFLHQVCPAAAYSMTYFDLPKEGKRVFSLRSRKGFDVSELAKRFGGGGHAAAAGFTLRVGTFFPAAEA